MIELDVVDISLNWETTSCSLSSFARSSSPRRYRHALRSYHEPPGDTEALGSLAIGSGVVFIYISSETSSHSILARYRKHPLAVEDHALLPRSSFTPSSHPGRLLHQLPKAERRSTLASDQLPTGPVQTITTHMYAFSIELRISLYETTRQLCSSRATNMIFSSRLASVCHNTSEGGMISLPALPRVEHRSRKPTLFSARST